MPAFCFVPSDFSVNFATMKKIDSQVRHFLTRVPAFGVDFAGGGLF